MLNLFFPKECLICSKIGAWLCTKCRKKLFQTLPVCYKCKTLSNKYQTHEQCLTQYSLDKVTTIWKYNEQGRQLIHNYKYKHRFKIADFLYSLFEDKLPLSDFKDSILIPMPSYKMKTLERGFNPVEIICLLLKEKLYLNINNNIVLKDKNNSAQAQLAYNQRVDNVDDIFHVSEKHIKEIEKCKKIIIVDDIITTGATLNEITKTLREYIPVDVSLSALCIFQGNFKKNEFKKSLQPNR